MSTFPRSHRVVFDGDFGPGRSHDEIRLRLLKAYRGNQEIVNRFFTGRQLTISKGIDYQAALKICASFERMGLRCRITDDKEGRLLPRDPSARPVLQGTKLQNIVAVAMILLLFSCIGIRIWALSKSRGIRPLDNVVTNGDTVCVHINKTLYVLTRSGDLIQKVDLIGLGFDREPADIDLLDDGDILIGNLDRKEILRCSGSPLSCRKIGPAGGYIIAENFKFIADEERGILFIADTNNNALLYQDLEGTYIKQVDTDLKMSYPNDMAFDETGHLWLSDTANRRVLAFEIAGESVFYSGMMIETATIMKEGPPGTEESMDDLKEMIDKIRKENERLKDGVVRTRPLALAWDSDDNLWVAASDGPISSAVVKVFDLNGEQTGRFSMGQGSVPVAIARMGDSMLVADSGLLDIFSLGPESDKTGPYGSEAFRAEISGVRSEFRRYESIKKWSGCGIWVLALGTLILVIVVLMSKGKNKEKRLSSRGRVPLQRSVRARGESPGGESIPLTPARRYGLQFTGEAGEYFRIWIVNAFLTIVTLGIYAAWAKVRTRKYFYRNTVLDGHAFDYTADPKAILKGYLIVGSGITLYSLTRTFNPLYGLAIAGLFGAVVPVLVHKSLRFFTYHSVYRNIRYRFGGTLRESYRIYLFVPLLIPFTLGLITPYWAYLKKKYFFHNVAYGATRNSFKGTHGPFYGLYIGLYMAITGVIIAGIFAAGIIMVGARMGAQQIEGAFPLSAVWMVVWIYGVMLIAVTFSRQYIYAWTTNYCFRNSEMGEVRFESTLNGWKLFWIQVSNIAAILFSAGLLTPWAKIRRMRYMADNLAIVTSRDLNDFASTLSSDESSYGDVAADFFDFEIGL